MSDLDARVLAAGAQFEGRLDAGILQDALSYVQYGEARLAVETLCDQLYEYDTLMTQAEFDAVAAVAAEVKADPQRLDPLLELVV